ncbi:MAG: arylamine N-acetyltransferase, partial [Alphaproteobacteria bacterium]|nr:arylamine N-acetyltransferase [Alphaproteobacteria bacterium]
MDLDAYLARIGHAGPRDVNAETLRALHRAHLETVPFENLDIHLGRPIVLNEAALFEKIVGRRRGGFCFELNGLFAALLRELGFAVSLLSARVVGKDGALAPEFDHLTLLVETEGRWLADVGFGDGFTEPLCLDGAGPQRRGDSEYRLARRDGDWRMAARPPGGPWRDRYQFSLTPRRLADFTAMCDHHQTSADSHFTQSR